MRSIFFVLLCVFCCAARAEFPPDNDVESAIDGARDDGDDRDNPFSGQPDEIQQKPKRLNPHTRMKNKGERRLSRDGREIDSDEDGDTEETVEMPKRKAAIVRLGFYGGYSRLGNSDANVNTARDSEGLTATFPLGLTADVRAWRYFGLDLDGYYSIAPSQSIVSGSGTTSVSGSKQIQVSGGSAMLKAIYPFDRSGSTRWFPSIGAGYGYHSLKHTESTSSSTIIDQMTASGPLLGGGIAIESASWLFALDVQLGVGGAGDVNETGSSSAFDSPGGGQFMRARLGVSYQVVPHFFLGGELLYRSMEVTQSNALQPVTSGTSGSSSATASGTQPTGSPETQLTFVVTAQYAF